MRSHEHNPYHSNDDVEDLAKRSNDDVEDLAKRLSESDKPQSGSVRAAQAKLNNHDWLKGGYSEAELTEIRAKGEL